MKKIVFTFVLSIAGFLSVKAQHSNTASQRISLMVRNTMRLNISAGTVPERVFNNSVYMNGETILKESVFQIRSNLPWIITVSTGNSIFNNSSKISPSFLGVHLKGGTGFLPVINSSTSIMVGGQGSGNFNVNYKPLPGFNYRAERIYNVSIIYSQQ
jgi:hypothetical protein